MALCKSLSLFTLCGPALLLAAQIPPVAGNAQPAGPPPTARAVLPSATLQPSLDVLRTALVTMRLDRWKASNAIRDEAQANIGSIQRDVQTTLPALLATADAAPASAAKALTVYRNVEALYDVTLRVDDAARLAAPPDQMSAIDQALARLDDSRRALGDQLQQTAATQEVQIVHLQAALKAIPPPAPQPPPPVIKCAAPPVIHSRKKPTAAKPAAPPTNPQNSTTPSH
jgi:hypothetical protein